MAEDLLRTEGKEALSEEGREESLTAEGMVCEPSVFRALKVIVAGGMQGEMIGDELGEEEPQGPLRVSSNGNYCSITSRGMI